MHVFELFLLLALVTTFGITVLCFLLAKSKNLNHKLAIVYGVIPIYNIFALIYYVGITKKELSDD